MIALSVMRMNKKGQAEDTSMLKIIAGGALLVLVVIILYVGISNVGNSAKAAAGQLPNDVSSIASACKFEAESGVNVLSSPYCIQARDVQYGTSILGIGGYPAKVNCPYAEKNKWFTYVSTTGKTKPDCGIESVAINDWAKSYCQTLQSTQGTKYKDTLVVDGQPCGGSVTPNWGVSTTTTGTSATAPTNNPTASNTKSCLQLGGEFADSTGKCPTAKPVKRTDHIDIGPGQEICCVAVNTA